MGVNLSENEVISAIRREIQQVYLADARPWVIGYSGGKDSTMVVQLVFEALAELPPQQRSKDVYVISSDTLVENPLIISFIDKSLQMMADSARNLELPITTHKVSPEYKDSFWINLIGKGYPSPRQHFRWCTDRLKIDPTNKFITAKISEYGEVIVVLGIRSAESASRAQSISKHSIEDRLLQRHTTLNNAYIYAPIRDLSTHEVWKYLLGNPAPWGIDHQRLLDIYQDSSEEPIFMLDKSAPATGNSRFGCWVCTVVTEDKALLGLINNSNPELKPLLVLRDWIYEIRDQEDRREKKRQNGRIYYVGEGESQRVGLGPFTMETRKEILRRLLETQRICGEDEGYKKKYGKPNLITLEELRLIDQIWLERGNWESSVPIIWEEVMGHRVQWAKPERALFTQQEIKILEVLSNQNDVPLELVHKLLMVEEKHSGFAVKRGLFDGLDLVLNEQWLHQEEEV